MGQMNMLMRMHIEVPTMMVDSLCCANSNNLSTRKSEIETKLKVRTKVIAPYSNRDFTDGINLEKVAPEAEINQPQHNNEFSIFPFGD